ncbi:MAG: Virginiamycin lyase [Planctomycetota bacterium]|jgi:hypothetical protein
MKTSAILSGLLLLAACSSAPRSADASSATEASASVATTTFPGFKTFSEDGRLIVFREEDAEAATFLQHRELGKSVTRIGVGPGGATLRAPDAETIEAFLLSGKGFVVRLQEGRLWVFAANSPEWREFLQHGEPAKSVTRIGAGPDGKTVKAPDAAVLDGWLASR